MTLTTASLHDGADTGVVDEKPDPAARCCASLILHMVASFRLRLVVV